MAHTCPECGFICRCNSDIDDLNFGDKLSCTCCRDMDDEYYGDDEDDWEERKAEEEAEYAATCSCGAWQFNSKGWPIHVADCICGAQ